jgi:DNA-binding response OmpR family regulator
VPPDRTEAPPPGRLVLVVEDEALIAMHLDGCSERHGWRVLGPVATVARALRLLDGGGEVPAVALLDANLRGEMVTPVAERLRALGVPFVVASAYDGARLAELGLGGAPSVGKPAREAALLAALERAAQS